MNEGFRQGKRVAREAHRDRVGPVLHRVGDGHFADALGHGGQPEHQHDEEDEYGGPAAEDVGGSPAAEYPHEPFQSLFMHPEEPDEGRMDHAVSRRDVRGLGADDRLKLRPVGAG